MLKKQDQTQEQTTMVDSKSHIAQEESAQVVANKDKQIELLSNMLEQKGSQLRKKSEETDECKVKLSEKEIQVQNNTIENQELKVKVNKLQKLINNDSNAKVAYNTELLIDQNKQLKDRIEQMHKQSQLKDQEITHLQGRHADYEKRIVLLQQQSKDNKLLQKMQQENGINQAHIKNLMMPFTSANMNRSNFGTTGGFGQPSGFGNFYNQQVYKPIRGGGGKATLDRSSQALNFSEFMENQNYTSNKKRHETVKQTLNQSNRFRSVSKTPTLMSKKDHKK